MSAPLEAMRARIGRHGLLPAIGTRAQLRVFMEHRVYAVWDFMSLIKSLQRHLAPARIPWLPAANPRHVHFINRLVLEEESDLGDGVADRSEPTSHFDLYVRAMSEVGADTGPVSSFVAAVAEHGMESAMRTAPVPPPARRFMACTFEVIARDQPHPCAAALAWGRETLVPQLFEALARQVRLKRDEAPTLYLYLERHIHLDRDEHGPMALSMVRELCGSSSQRWAEASEAAQRALEARLALWDGILEALPRAAVRQH